MLVVGPGAMGQMHAALLRRNGVDVALLHRDEERAAALNDTGVRLVGAAGDTTVAVPCLAEAAALGPAHFIVIFTKAYDTEAAARTAVPAATPETVWVTLQNGLGNVEAVRAAVGDVFLLCGVTASGAHIWPDGAVNVVAVGEAVVGPVASATMQQARAFCELLEQADMPCRAVDDPWPAVWRKLAINAAINPLAALAGRRNGELMEVPWLRWLAFRVAREVGRVAAAQGVDLGCDPASLVEEVCRATAANRCSMLQDLEAGRPTEIDQICGAVAALAPSDAPARLCEALVVLVKHAEVALKAP
ncbi:MAG: 2-dehydropantoate 2-reductase [Armatimonadetes bacterium]|nr:2-dehydropantoate 2-reductase [Armatimonadota bacterium]